MAATSGRYWGERSVLVERSHLQLADAGHASAVGLGSLESAIDRRCTVALGSPGSGKSTELLRFVATLRDQGECAQFEDLRKFGESRWLHDIIVDGAAAGHGGPAYLVLDSWDESPLAASTLARVLGDALAATAPHVRIVLACRTAAWNSGLEAELASKVGDVKVVSLAPLSPKQVADMAVGEGVDVSTFLSFVDSAGAAKLMGTPQMVKMLAGLIRSDGDSTAPLDQRSLFERAVKGMLTDPDPLRALDNRPLVLATAASVVAAIALLTGARAIWLGHSDAPSDALLLDELEGLGAPQLWSGLEREVSLTREVLRAAVQSPLFTNAGQDRVWFSHQMLAEFLAASALTSSALPPGQVERLVRGPKGLVAPQVQALSAWLLALDPMSYKSLIEDDPESFVLSGAEMVGERYREALLKALLDQANRHELWPSMPHSSLRTLNCTAASGILKPYLEGVFAGIEARYLAIRIARENRILASVEDIERVALDSSAPIPLRNAAAHALLDFNPMSAPVLADALLDDQALAADEDEQLRGAGLLAALEAGRPVEAIVPFLVDVSNEDFLGSYRMVLLRNMPEAVLGRDLSVADLEALIAWYFESADREGSSRRIDRSYEPLRDAILLACLKHSADRPSIRRAVTLILLDRVVHGHAILKEYSGPYRHEIDESTRQHLLRSSVEALAEQEEDANYGVFVVCRDLAGPDDLEWFVGESLTATSPPVGEVWAFMARAVLDIGRRDHVDLCLEAPEDSTVYRVAFAHWREQVMFGSEEARLLRRAYQRQDRDEEGQGIGEDKLRELFASTLESDCQDAFCRLFSQMRIDPAEDRAFGVSPLDVREMPGFRLISPEDHFRITELAIRFLDSRDFDPAPELGTNTIMFGSIAGVAATLWIAEAAPDQLTRERLVYWAPAFIHNWDSSNPSRLTEITRRAYDQDVDRFLENVSAEVRQEHGEISLRRLEDVLDSRSVEHLIQWISCQGATDSFRAQALVLLLGVDQARGREKLREELRNRGPRAAALAIVAAQVANGSCWSMIRESMESSDDFAGAFIEGVAYRESMDAAAMEESEIGWLWGVIMRLFPVEEDPAIRGAHSVGVREMVGHFRDRLLPGLAERGTDSSIAVLNQCLKQHPEQSWIRRLIVDAKRRRARNAWVPMERGLLLTLWSHPKRRLIAWSGDLLDVVVEALGRVQAQLTEGPNPQATMLWNHAEKCVGCLPKSEDDLNDYLAVRLREELPLLVVSREVEVHRKGRRGVGERPDMLITASTPNPAGDLAELAIEGKGCWNDEVLTAMECQLLNRYVKRLPGSSGLLVVYWFEPDHLTRRLSWVKDPVRSDRAELEVRLQSEAKRLTTAEAHLGAAVLHASLNWKPVTPGI